MGKSTRQRPELEESYSLTERRTNGAWIDDKPIFRRVVLIPGAGNSSGITVAALANAIDTLVNASWSILEGVTFHANRADDNTGATQAGVDITESTGAITVFHSNQDYSGDTINLVLEYTKQ